MKYKLIFKQKEETERKIIYVLDMDSLTLSNGTKYKLNNGIIAPLTRGLKEIGLTFNKLLIFSLGKRYCYSCNKEINYKYHRKMVSINKYCNNKCFFKSKVYKEARKERYKRRCRYCKLWFYGDTPINNILEQQNYCCNNTECIKKREQERGLKIKKNHWAYRTEEYKSNINKKKSITRKKNDLKYNRKYYAWNKNKTGIYSKETIEKIRQAAIKQFHEGRIKKTKIEIIIENLLKEMSFDYKYSFILQKRQYDFLLKKENIIIEVQGSFWHGDLRLYGENKKKGLLREHQKMKKLDDKVKSDIAKENGYELIALWESDIHKKFDKIKEIFSLIKEGKIQYAKENAEKLCKN